ncbi:unnamed protein product, partial [Brugia pahangi]|uniref:Fructose-2,6-bisphosphatase n=1 Tax=Brugia pahangi TaxID=6280 RepID=A0A0N4U0C1_BRUPA
NIKISIAEKIPGDLRIWSSQKIRAAQTAQQLSDLAAHIEFLKVLDEIDAVCFDCLFVCFFFFLNLYDKTKFKSYEDLVGRLEPVIMELERQSNVLVVSHQAILRCILAYFDNKNYS